MPFAGTIGSVEAQPGSLVPGLVSEFGTQAFGLTVHSLTSRSIRIKYDRPVNDSLALNIDSYRVTKVSLASYLPKIESVRPYELDNMQYEMVFENSLTLNSVYSLEVFGVSALNNVGGVNVGAYNFVATVPDYAIAIGAYSHKEGYVVIEFDRQVYPYTDAVVASISPSDNLSVFQALTWIPNTNNVPTTFLLFQIGTLDTTNSNYRITFNSVKDLSLNSASGNVDFNIPSEILRPLNSTNIKSIKLLFSRVTDWYYDHNNPDNSYLNIRVFFNTPVDIVSAKNISNWSISINGSPAEFVNINSSWADSFISYEYASSSLSCPDAEYFWHVDLRVRSSSLSPNITIEAKIKSENGLTETVPLTTGYSIPKSQSSELKSLKRSSYPTVGFLNRWDTGLYLNNPPTVSYPIVHGSSYAYSISTYSMFWLLTNLWTSFNGHRQNAVSHSTVDQVNSIADEAPSNNLSDMISSANLLKARILNHSTTAEYHVNVADYRPFAASDARDLKSLERLVLALANYFIHHTTNEFLHQGFRLNWLSASSSDQIITAEPLQLVGHRYDLEFDGYKVVTNNESGEFGESYYKFVEFTPGSDYPPFISTAIPVPGLRLEFNGEVIRSDEVEVYFSKPMNISKTFAYNFVSTSPLLEVTGYKWPSMTRLLFNVNKMRSKSYSLSLTGVTDAVGNLVP